MLWSINERLAGREGVSLPVLSDDWLEDLCMLAQVEAEEREESANGDDNLDDYLE